MPLVQTRGAASAQGFGEFAQAAPPANYIDDVFSTFLYTGTGSSQTITNGIDLAGKGGMVWTKQRSGTRDNNIVDTVRGGDNMVYTNQTIAQFSLSGLGFSPFTFSSTGFVASNAPVNAENATTFCSWTFREQAKFFDVVTYTGNGGTQAINHALGSTPGMVIVKRTDTASLVGWVTYHRSVSSANDNFLLLNSTAAPASAPAWISPTSTNFTIGNYSDVNANGGTFVAYLFAHNAGGFGTAGTDNVISCGSYTGNTTVTLGYEPQWIMIKRTDNIGNWDMHDNMRGWPVSGDARRLEANTSDAEDGTAQIFPSATGFTTQTGDGATYIYMAIRRPMKPPTSGTQVFSPNLFTEIVSIPTPLTSGFAPDLYLIARRNYGSGFYWADRLRGSTTSANNLLTSASTAGEVTFGITPTSFASNTGLIINQGFNNLSGSNDIAYQFRRATGFFDVVCFTGTGTANISHNLGVVPELMIVKQRATAGNSWGVYSAPTGNTNWLALQSTGGANADSTMWNNTTPTNTVFTIGSTSRFSGTCVAYLFATLAGVSKVGSYTGTGAAQVINCGFTAGARFVMIKRTDDADWWIVFDSARGIVAGNDPYLLLNDAVAEASGYDQVDADSSGFIVNTNFSGINAPGGSYIFLAIA